MKSIEEAASIQQDLVELSKITSQKHEAFGFKRRTDEAFQLEISEAKRQDNKELKQALRNEARGFSKPKMTDQERIDEN